MKDKQNFKWVLSKLTPTPKTLHVFPAYLHEGVNPSDLFWSTDIIGSKEFDSETEAEDFLLSNKLGGFVEPLRSDGIVSYVEPAFSWPIYK